MPVELNDVALVFQGPILYDAKILRIYSPSSGKVMVMNEKTAEIVEANPDRKFPAKFNSLKAYYVHYVGWNNKYNEWVGLDRLLERTAENLLLQKNLLMTAELKTAPDKPKKKPAAANGKASSSSSHHPKSSKSARDSRASTTERSPSVRVRDTRGHFLKKPDISIEVPTEIKVLLVKDWENVTNNEMLVSLPSKFSVGQTLKEFAKMACDKYADDEAKLDNYLEITESLRTYFNRSLGTLLLYRYEREQYKELLQKHSQIEFADLYSPIFLLRLCSIFPNLMTQCGMDMPSMCILKRFLEEFYVWLCKGRDQYLVDTYENCMPMVQFMN